ncbi:hypothetical protein AFLA70_4g008151 [Aspergillus flavus AF70]|nr:hypothetical protein AFLA70_4g008151 [Aspergillus flavus AF70]
MINDTRSYHAKLLFSYLLPSATLRRTSSLGYRSLTPPQNNDNEDHNNGKFTTDIFVRNIAATAISQIQFIFYHLSFIPYVQLT